MKKIIKRFWGVGLIVIILSSLFVSALPVTADDNLWTVQSGPSTTSYVAANGSDVADIAVFTSGSIVYAVTGTGHGAWTGGTYLYKSTNGGATWARTNSTALSFAPNMVAVAPDNSDRVAVAASSNGTIYVSVNGGSTFANVGPVTDGSANLTVFKDIAISPTRNGANYVTVCGVDTTGPAIWYYNVGAVVGQTWTRKAAPQAVSVDALAYSPNFVSDLTLEVVTDNATHVGLQIYSFASAAWNTADYQGYPVNVLTDLAFTGVTKASLALDPGYLGGEDTLRNSFIGLTLTGDTNGVSGIYRVLNTTPRNLSNANIYSVAYDGTTLVAGRSDSSIVYRSLDPMGSSPTVTGTSTYKSPSGAVATVTSTVVAFVGANIAAGTTGQNSGFSLSRSSGAAFNDISFVDTVSTTTNYSDMAVSADGSQVYFISCDNNNQSLWLKTAAWERVLTFPFTGTYYIIRLSPANANTVYLGEKTSTKVFFSKDVQSRWFQRTSTQNIVDMAVESDDVAYILNATGGVVKSINDGFIWDTTVKDSKQTTGYSIASVATNVLLVGSAAGKVSYSTDGGTTWTGITPAIAAAGATNTIVIPAPDYATSNTIYAASTAAGLNIYKWVIGGTATAWTAIKTTSPLTATESVYGLETVGSNLYALTYDSTAQTSYLKQFIPSVNAWASAAAPQYVPASGISENVTLGRMNFSDNGLYGSKTTSAAGLWALGWSLTTNTQLIYLFNDTLSAASPAISGPVNAASVSINSMTGASDVVVLTWARVANGTTSTVQLAYDSAFTQTLTITTTLGAGQVADPAYNVVIGQGQNGVTLTAGKTYYWRVRESAPVNSPWSEVRSFTVQPMAAAVPVISSPANGTTIKTQNPAFSWSPVTGTTAYEIQLSVGPVFAATVWTDTATSAGDVLPSTMKLDQGVQYFWRVRASQPIQGDWSTAANFMVAAPETAAPPPVTITNVPQPTFTIPAPPPATTITIPAPVEKQIAPTYIWAIIIIGAILVIAVIVLIVRTRRSV